MGPASKAGNKGGVSLCAESHDYRSILHSAGGVAFIWLSLALGMVWLFPGGEPNLHPTHGRTRPGTAIWPRLHHIQETRATLDTSPEALETRHLGKSQTLMLTTR